MGLKYLYSSLLALTLLGSCQLTHNKQVLKLEQETELSDKKQGMNTQYEIFETEEFWRDDSLYCFLNIGLNLDRETRLALTGDQGPTSRKHVINRLWVKHGDCKIGALKIYEKDLGDRIQVRGLFLVDDFTDFKNTLLLMHETMITEGDAAVSQTFTNGYEVDYSPSVVKSINSEHPRANIEWYRHFFPEENISGDSATRCN
jgi:hypothetical protein